MSPKTPMLFEVEPSPSRRVSNRDEMESLKRRWSIQTHVCHDSRGRNWMALSMSVAAEVLKGYDLTDDEKSDIAAIMAGYCRLLDECGLAVDGFKTEFAAVAAAAEAAERFSKV